MSIPLRIVSDYSLLKSIIKLPTLITYLKKLNIPACGICDDNLFGVIEFYDLCVKENIKPLIGLNVPFLNVNLSLFAKNYDGYLNLLKIHTYLQKKEDLANLNKELFTNLYVLLDAKYILHYEEIVKFFSENLYVAYQNDVEKINAYLKTSQVVFAQTVNVYQESDLPLLKILKAIEENTDLKNVEVPVTIYQTLTTVLEASNEDSKTTLHFADLCNVVIKKGNRYIPKYDETITNSANFLIALAKKGLQKRLNNQVSASYVKRLKYELDVIQKMGFVDYFLIVYDYVKYAKQHGILVGVGRGSAVGSLVSYSLGITDVNPLQYNLLFERFLNPERVTMPDIDVDFEFTRRDEVVAYVKEKYGFDKVANIMAFGTLKCKLAIRCVCKCYNIADDLTNTFTSLFNPTLTLQENLENPLIKKYLAQNEELQKIVKITKKIEGLKKHITTHAAGVVISSIPLDEVIPIYYNGTELLTGVTMNYLEELGLIKMDFLSIRNLTTIANIIKLIEKYRHQKINLLNIPLNDELVLKSFQNGETTGIFQFESEGMKSFLKKLHPESFNDIVSAIALYRPGPRNNIDTFIRRKEGKEKITYLHPSLESILKDTYGIIVYQEQIMQILVKVGNYRFSEADLIRRAMSKKKKEIIEAREEDFIKRATTNGYTKECAQEIYNLILNFASYGFNKSHSVGYAIIGVQMAYLKQYYPIFFLADLLNMALLSVEKTKEYLTLAKKYNIKFLRPDVNKSTDVYQFENNQLRMPLSLIKSLGDEAVKNILEERKKEKFASYLDFVARCYGKSLNKKMLEALIKAGALDDFGFNRATMLYNLNRVIDYASLVKELDKNFVVSPEIEIIKEESNERNEELEIFGFYITNHPSSKYQSPQVVKVIDQKKYFNQRIILIVLIEKITKIKTKNNEDMAFITASDETGVGNFVIFHNELMKSPLFKVGDLIKVNGRVTKRLADFQININQISLMEKE